MGKRMWSDDDIRLLREMNKNKVPLTEMAERLGRSYGAVVCFRSQHGIAYPDIISKADMQKATDLRRRGYSCPEIARRFNVSSDFMWTRLKHIVPECSGSVWNMDMVDRLESAIMCSDTLQEVADKIEKSLESVKNFCFLRYGTIVIKKLRKEICEYFVS